MPKRFTYNYYFVYVPEDLGDYRERCNIAISAAMDRARLHVWPALWTAKEVEGDPEMIRVCRKRYNRVAVKRPRQVKESQTAYQLALIDYIDSKPAKPRPRKVDTCLAQVRKLSEELNQLLYANPSERPVIHHPTDAYNVLGVFMGHLEQEELWTANLDTRNRIKSVVRVYRGSVNHSSVRVAEVFRQAIIETCPNIIIAHNHPSGDANPSPDDVAVTRAIVQAGQLLDIEVLDHLIITHSWYCSLKERNLGFNK